MSRLDNPSNESIEKEIAEKGSFTVHVINDDILDYCSRIEHIIEASDMSCRVRTKNRTLINFGLVLGGVGLAGFMAQMLHNMVTFNPDWEVIRNPLNNQIQVTYCPGVFN